MRKLVLVATVLVCSCSKPTRVGGLIASLRLASGAKVSCADVRVKNTQGTELGSTQLAFSGKAEVQLGIGSDNYPRDIVISVQPLWSASGCTGAKPNGALVEKPAQFPLGGVETIVFDLGAPAANVDADRDGFAGVVGGGPDCNDMDATAFPGANEDCLTLNDLDCDGQGGCADAQCSAVPGCAQPATLLAFTTPARTVQTDACSPALTVESRNMAGMAAVLPGGAVLTFAAAPAAGVQFFSDAACTLPVTQLTAAAPSSSFTFHFTSAMAGTVDVTVASGALTSAMQTQTVTPPGASRLGFATPARTVVAGECSMAVEVEAQDGAGTPRMVSADLAVSLGVAAAGAVVFFSDAACTTGMEVTSVTIPTGQSKATFYVRGVTAGTTMLSATAAGFSAASQSVTVNAGMAARLAFVSAQQGLAVNTCSAVAQVRAEDGFGNAATLPGPLMLTLMASGVGGFTFHDDLTCGAAISQVSLAAAAGSLATFHFKGSMVGSATMTVSGGGLTPATQPASIGVGPPDRLVFTTGAHTVQAGACSPPVTVTLQDASGNPVNPPAAIAVTLAGMPSMGFTAYGDTTCSVPLSGPLMLSGSPSATFRFRAQRTPSQRIDAAAPMLTAANQTHVITGAAPASLSITTAQHTVTAGGCSPLVHVDVLDGFGNAVGVTNLPVTYASTASMVTFHGSAAGCMSAAPMNVTSTTGFDFRFVGNAAGPLPLTVSSGALTAAMQTHTVNAGAAARLSFTTNSRTQQAGACSPTPLNIETQDLAGNRVPVTMGPVTVNLSANDGGFTFHDSAGCMGAAVNSITIANMTASQNFWFVGRRTGVSTVTAAATGFTADTQNETITPAPPSELVITTPARSTPANVCSAEPVRFETRDAFGNLSAVASQVFVSVDGGSNVQAHVGPACAAPQPSIQLDAGTSSAVFHVRGATAGTFPVTVSLPGFTGDSQNVTITPGITQLAFSTSPFTRYAGECVGPVTVQSRDASNNPTNTTSPLTVNLTAVNGFTFFSDSSCTTAASAVNIAAGTSSASFYFRAVTGGTFMLGATSGSLTGASQSVTIHPAVRRGDCTIGSGNFSVTCNIPAPALLALDRTFLVYQAEPDNNDADAADTLARCHVATTSTIVCRRGANPGGGTTVGIHWQTVTLPTAANVQHVRDITCANNGVNQSVSVSNLGNTGDVFTLRSVAVTGGNVDDNEYYTTTVSSPTAVTLTHAAQNCNYNDTHDLQVVKLAGATVERGTAQFSGNRQVTVGSLPAIDRGRTMLLYSWRTTSVGNDTCERNVRGLHTSTTAVQFNRANGNTAGACTDDGTMNVAFERVEFPTGWRVQQIDVTMAHQASTATVNIPSQVDPSRSFITTGAQTHSGGAIGETEMDNAQSASHYVADFAMNSTGTQFTARRGNTAEGAVRYAVYVVEVDPR